MSQSGDALTDAGIEAMRPRDFLRERFPNATQLGEGERITQRVAVQLAAVTELTPQFWMNLQRARDNFEFMQQETPHNDR